jgi:hypothetical protein
MMQRSAGAYSIAKLAAALSLRFPLRRRDELQMGHLFELASVLLQTS